MRAEKVRPQVGTLRTASDWPLDRELSVLDGSVAGTIRPTSTLFDTRRKIMGPSAVPTLTRIVLLFLLIGSAPAQFPLPLEQVRAAGHGAIKLSFDLQAQVANDLLLGCVYLNGMYYVSGRNSPGPFHVVYEFDATGALVGQFDQLESPAMSPWGYRDGATDGVSLMFGSENGVFVIDTDGNPHSSVMAANGAQFLSSNPIGGAALALLGTFRGLAYDPRGNGGDGSLWVGNFGSPLVEFDLDGAVLQEHPNQGLSIYGLAMDVDAGSLWVSAALSSGDLVEVDPTTGALTTTAISRYNAGSAPGGLSRGPGTGTFVALDQASSDRLTVYRNHLRPTEVLGRFEERLLISVNAGPFRDSQFRPVAPGATVEYMVTGNTFPGLLNVTVWNFGVSAGINGVTTLAGAVVPELVALSDISMPPGVNILVNQLNGLSSDVVVPAGIFPDGELIRLQAVHLLPSAAVIATNQIYLTIAGSTGPQVRVETVGTNSLNSDPTSGFFRVIHLGNGAGIEQVVMTWVGSGNPAQATMEWDTDSIDLGDRFDGGNSVLDDCQGTYRNGSDVATGLRYPGSSVSVCDSAARTGWIGSVPGNSAADWRTLTFNFTPGAFVGGRMFEFDADTDGGQGVTGADMEGMIVTVRLTGGAVLSGSLAVDAGSALPRSFVDL